MKKEILEFVSRIWNSSHIKIIISDPERIGRGTKVRDLDKIKKMLTDFKTQTGINEFSFVEEGGQLKRQVVWQQKKRKRIVINFFSVKDINELEVGLSNLVREIKEERERAIEGIELTKTTPKETVTSKTVEPKKIKEEKIPSKELLLDLGGGVKVYLSNGGNLKVRAEHNFLSLVREDGEILTIWFRNWLKEWKETPEVVIREKEYKLKENTIVELEDDFEWVNDRLVRKEKKDREFLLRKGKEGERIIDLGSIRGNPELDMFLRDDNRQLSC